MDTLANALTGLRNATMAGHTSTRVAGSKHIMAVLEALKGIGYITDATADGRFINVQLVPGMIRSVKRISKPGRRLYAPVNEIPHARRGRGCMILSTSAGIMTDSAARKAKMGGEVLCEILRD